MRYSKKIVSSCSNAESVDDIFKVLCALRPGYYDRSGQAEGGSRKK